MTENQYENLGKTIYEKYFENGFGKILKSEIDTIVFHSYLLGKTEILSDKNQIDYNKINKNTIYNFSLETGLSESTIQSKIEADYYYQLRLNKGNKQTEEQFNLKEFIENQLKRKNQNDSEFVKEGKLKVFIANPILKKQFVNALSTAGGIPDFSFNKDIVSINVFDAIKILEISDEAVNKVILEKSKNYLVNQNDQKLKQIAEKTQGGTAKETVKNIITYMGKTAYEKFLDAAFAALFAQV